MLYLVKYIVVTEDYYGDINSDRYAIYNGSDSIDEVTDEINIELNKMFYNIEIIRINKIDKSTAKLYLKTKRTMLLNGGLILRKEIMLNNDN